MQNLHEALRLNGSATVYRLYDVGYSISLEHAATLLSGTARGRAVPARLEARAIQVRNPPVVVSLGVFEVTVGGQPHSCTLSAHLFDFGVCSLQLEVAAPT